MDCTTVTAYGGKGAISLCHQGSSGTLPFTGLNLLVVLLIAFALIWVGTVLHRAGKK